MRNTTAKTEILSLIDKSDVALSQSEIQSLLPEGLCDRVTIYRVLDRLTDAGLIHKIVNIDGIIRFARCDNDAEHQQQHIHFNCEKCKAVTCLEDVEPLFKLPKHYKVNKINFMVSGLCPQCM